MVVRGFGVDPHQPGHVVLGAGLRPEPYSSLVGTTIGLHESFDGGATWSPVEAFTGGETWRITFDPATPGRYFVGTRPAAVHRTDDGGRTFTRLPLDLPDTCRGIGLPRITSMTPRPSQPEQMIVTVEIGGVHRTLDAGATWEQVMTDVASPLPEGELFGLDGRLDCHFSGLSTGAPDVAFVSTPDSVFVSDDFGTTWSDAGVKRVFPHQYHRDIAVKLDDPSVIFLGVGDDTAGEEGALLCSRDRGTTWQELDLPDRCNSPVWCFAQPATDPDAIVACTLLGMLFVSRDGGTTWEKARREFSEVRGICALANC
jgi:photosystem II stability/assembly factor-like uncharacterized protein